MGTAFLWEAVQVRHVWIQGLSCLDQKHVSGKTMQPWTGGQEPEIRRVEQRADPMRSRSNAIALVKQLPE